MSVELLMNELRKSPDEMSKEKILQNWFEKEVKYKTRIPKEDLHFIVALQTLNKNKRFKKLLPVTCDMSNNLVGFYLDDKISEDGLSRGEFERILVAERAKLHDNKSMNRWLGKDE
jgi:hypothetical protein